MTEKNWFRTSISVKNKLYIISYFFRIFCKCIPRFCSLYTYRVHIYNLKYHNKLGRVLVCIDVLLVTGAPWIRKSTECIYENPIQNLSPPYCWPVILPGLLSALGESGNQPSIYRNPLKKISSLGIYLENRNAMWRGNHVYQSKAKTMLVI